MAFIAQGPWTETYVYVEGRSPAGDDQAGTWYQVAPTSNCPTYTEDSDGVNADGTWVVVGERPSDVIQFHTLAKSRPCCTRRADSEPYQRDDDQEMKMTKLAEIARKTNTMLRTVDWWETTYGRMTAKTPWGETFWDAFTAQAKQYADSHRYTGKMCMAHLIIPVLTGDEALRLPRDFDNPAARVNGSDTLDVLPAFHWHGDDGATVAWMACYHIIMYNSPRKLVHPSWLIIY